MNVRSAELNPPVGRPTSSSASSRSAPPVKLVADATHGPGPAAVRACAALALGSLLLAIIGRLAGVEALALIGAYGVLFFGIGAAPFQLRADLELYARLTGTVLVGFSMLLIVGALMADIKGLWNPLVWTLALAIPTVWLHAVGLHRVRPLAPGNTDLVKALLTGIADPDDQELGRRYERDLTDGYDRLEEPTRESEAVTGEIEPVTTEFTPVGARGRRAPFARAGAALRVTPERAGLHAILLGTAFWLAPAIWTRDTSPGYWGMLATISPLWYVGLALVLLGFTLGRRVELSAALGALSFGLATTLTPALVYAAPREETAAKQMQIVQYALLHHHIHVTDGIYQAFSSLFSGVGGLSELVGIHGMLGPMSLWGLATYWPVLLLLLRVIVLRFLFGRLLSTTARCWCAVMLVLLVDSLGADYFSPQAVGYVMAIGAVAMAMNGRTRRPFSDRATIWLLLVAGVAMAPTHELSPYMAAGALIVLAIFGQAPRWNWLPIAIPALLWAAVVNHAISQNFSFSSLFNVSNFRPPVTVATPGLHRLAIVGTQSHMLLLALLILIGLGAIGFLAHIRERSVWAYALCPIVGIAFIAINPYGNEGIFRATLFAIPWMAVLAMRMPHPSRLLPPVFVHPDVLPAAIALALGGLLVTFLLAAYSMDGTSVLSRNDVALVQYLQHQPRSNALVLSVGSASDPADGANFTMRYKTLEWAQVAKGVPALQQAQPTAAAVTALDDQYEKVAPGNGATATSPRYLIWARSSQLYANAYGLQSSAQMYRWLKLLQTSSSWKLVHRNGNAYLFERT